MPLARLRLTALVLAALLAAPVGAPAGAEPARFIELVPSGGEVPVHLAVSQVVRVARVDQATAIDTISYVQQQSIEPVEAVAQRLMAAGLRLVPLTDLANRRLYVAPERVVIVRRSPERHAEGARASLVMAGLRLRNDVAVRETVEEVMAALGR
ncbi:hypothetical protein [Paracraurococcus ruber]|uniref:Uncharacterized protein n=1 Tax=Paracraurococcus ruber TaxID=77675 RepID=A0ABS1CXX3_9PROT|nr:hypothetical protein [Paracraurococcus ruber]MBK1659061.1 hypothetical protein [Paracraurococcus ruber]TDG30042.1 hypothetical protein E2C05_15905 [Paracraurococcus ruber]